MDDLIMDALLKRLEKLVQQLERVADRLERFPVTVPVPSPKVGPGTVDPYPAPYPMYPPNPWPGYPRIWMGSGHSKLPLADDLKAKYGDQSSRE